MRRLKVLLVVAITVTFSGYGQAYLPGGFYASAITKPLLEMHSAQYPMYESASTVEERVAKGLDYDSSHGEYLLIRGLRNEPEPGSARKPTRSERIDASIAMADIVAIGTPLRRVSALTARHSFIFSDYEVVINTVLTNRIERLPEGSTVVVSRVGGRLTLGGASIHAIDPEFQLLHLREKYIFFLHYDEQSKSFLIGSSDAYLISGDSVIAGKTHSKILPEPAKTDDFLNDLTALARKREDR